MNKSILIGRLTRDPEVRETITKYTLAVDRRDKDKTTDFIDCVAFGKAAEFAQKFLKKGTKIAVIGRIQTGSYEAKDGRKVKTFDIVVESQEFVESKASQTENQTESKNDFVIPEDLSDLPFK